MKKLQVTRVRTGSQLTSKQPEKDLQELCQGPPFLSSPALSERSETSKRNHGDCAPSHRTVWFQRQMSGKQRCRDVVVSGPEAGVSERCLSRKKIHLA